MSNTLIDLSNCDTEPIHISGQIQSHGFLIAIDENLIISHYSDNITSFLPEIGSDLLGKSMYDIQHLIAVNQPADFIDQLIVSAKESGFEQHKPFYIDLKGVAFYLLLSPASPYYLLEFEPALPDMHSNIQKDIGRSMSEMLTDRNLQNLLHNTVIQVKKVIGYDRVMIYRFAQDGHGEVVAEARNEDLPPFLGQHYPASDIPKQARELYKLNFTRLIGDVHTTPSKILSPALTHVPLDLTYSQLRAVSPIHIQYLKNMKVDSSFSISLIYHNELWGLIACHNYSPRYIDYKARESAWLLGLILSSGLEFRKDEQDQLIFEQFKISVDTISKNLQKGDSLKKSLTGYAVTLLDIADVTGAVLVYENNLCQLGVTPDTAQLIELIKWLKVNMPAPIYYSTGLSAVYPAAADYKVIASGIMAVEISKELGEYIIWFKPEVKETIKWAGNPDKPVTVTGTGLQHISPRTSFEVWLQTVEGKSNIWNEQEIKSVNRMREEVVFAINQKAIGIRIMNEKLKLAYEELDTFSYTISHDLKNPLAVIKGYSELLSLESMSGDTAYAVGRIIAGANKMHRMINEILQYSQIGNLKLKKENIRIRPLIEGLIEDLKMIFKERTLIFHIGDTPDIQGDPLMVSQVFTNLLSNAVKYSHQSDPSVIHVEGLMINEEVVYKITDNGLGIDAKLIPVIFGLFQRLDNADDIEGSGVGLAIVKRIIDKHRGKIWVESEVGKGSTFCVVFNL